MRVLACLAIAIGYLLTTATPSTADPTDDIIAALTEEQIYRAPGAIASFDEARVRAELAPNTRILVEPFGGHEGGQAARIETWAQTNHLELITVEGLMVHGGAPDQPDDLPLLRQVTAYSDITHPLLAAVRAAAGKEKPLETGVVPTPPVPPAEIQVDEVAARLMESRVHNAPGRADPIDLSVVQHAADLGHSVRVAAFPVVTPGGSIVDYAPGLAKRFPDDVVLVFHGRWLDIASPDQTLAESARDYLYSLPETHRVRGGGSANDFVDTVVERYELLVSANRFGAPQPIRESSTFRRVVLVAAPWLVVGSAAAFVVVALVRWRRGRDREARSAQLALRVSAARAMASIGELSAELLATDRGGSAAGERLTTARALYDQARTAAAMSEVKKVADEGLDLVRPGAAQERSAEPVPTVRPDESTVVAGGVLASGALLVLMVLVAMVTDTGDPAADISDEARHVVTELQHDVIYEPPESPDGLDSDRVRELIGERPIVVARVPGLTRRCDEIATVRRTDLVVVFEITPEGGFDGVVCFGPDYAPFGDFRADESARRVLEVARMSLPRQDGPDDMERIIQAYDVEAVGIYGPGPVPSRTPTAPLPRDKVFVWYFFLVAGIPFLGAMLIAFFRRRGRALVERAQVAHTRSDETDVRLNRLADAVLHPARPEDEWEARRQADLAEKYVLFLRDHEAGDAAEVEERLSELEQEVTR